MTRPATCGSDRTLPAAGAATAARAPRPPLRSRGHLLFVLPVYGFTGDHIRHPPLSLLYAVSQARQAGYQVDLLDNRLQARDWPERLRERLRPDTLLVGISVMLGYPIRNALEVSELVKRLRPELPVVWGGTFPSMVPELVLAEPAVDFVVCGYGARAVRELADHLAAGAKEPFSVTGLVWRGADGQVRRNPPLAEFEQVPFRDIPYDLIAADLPHYTMVHGPTVIFPIYSSYGCPYRCGFCISPAVYRPFPAPWQPIEAGEVAEHIAYLQQAYGAAFFYLYDDDPCCRPDHLRAVLRAIQGRRLNVTIGFRGLRVNEILALSDDDFSLLTASGVHILHVGVESGSPAALIRMDKGITVEQSLAANRRLARFPGLRVGYHFLVGTPGETADELQATMRLITTLAAENPRAFFFVPNKYIPTPGTAMYELARRHGFTPPADIRGWASLDAETAFPMPWDRPETDRLHQLLQLMAVIEGNLGAMLWELNRPLALAYALARCCYRPFLRLRVRYGCTGWLIESRILRLFRH